MHLKTILNRVQRFKSFVYGRAVLRDKPDGPELDVDVQECSASRGVCGGCGKRRPGYDRQPMRRYEFLPLWGIRVFFRYAPRRLECKRCGIRVEALPWALGKRPLTNAYAWHLAKWAKRLSWSEVARAFHTSWHHVFESVDMAVTWRLAHRNLEGVRAIGIDEIAWRKGHKYLTLVYQIDAGSKRLLWIGKDRKIETLESFFTWFGTDRSVKLKFICSDMWKPYLQVVAEKASEAIHVLDRFHIIAHINKAIDEVRAAEHKEQTLAINRRLKPPTYYFEMPKRLTAHYAWEVRKPRISATDQRCLGLKLGNSIARKKPSSADGFLCANIAPFCRTN